MKRILFGPVVLLLTACSVDIESISNDDAIDIVDNIKYVKDYKANLCYGVIAYQKGSIRPQSSQSGISLSCVPCDSVKTQLLNPVENDPSK